MFANVVFTNVLKQLTKQQAKFKYMNYFEKKKIEDKIKSDINDIKEFDEVEHFIDANFQQF